MLKHLSTPAHYFKYHVVARIRLSPGPTSAKEVEYLYNCFKGLSEGSTLEYFNVARGQPRHNVFDPELRMIFNPRQCLLSDPFDFDSKNDTHDLEQEQVHLVGTLKHLLALPRYSYIENDEEFLQNRMVVTFKHALTPEGLRYEGKYQLSESTVLSPFISIQSLENILDLRYRIRHNFQKYHKFDKVTVSTGFDSVRKVSFTNESKSVR